MIQINWAAAIAVACFVLGAVGTIATLIAAAETENGWWILLLIPAALFFGIAAGVVCGA